MNYKALFAFLVGLLFLINFMAYHLFEASWALSEFTGFPSFVFIALTLAFSSPYLIDG